MRKAPISAIANWFELPISATGIDRVNEIILILLLFADAVAFDLNKSRLAPGLPGRMVLIGLPLTMLVGAVLAYDLFPNEGIAFALLLGAILAPTGAGPGLPVFTSSRVPAVIRRALCIKSGLNYGISTPLGKAAVSAIAAAVGYALLDVAPLHTEPRAALHNGMTTTLSSEEVWGD